MKIYPYLIMVSAALFTHCTHSETIPESNVVAGSPPIVATPVAPPTPIAIPPKPMEEPWTCARLLAEPCDTRDFAATCQIAAVDDKVFAKGVSPKGWGKSVCEARHNLAAKFCKNGATDTHENLQLDCAPDPTAGQCPPAPVNCPGEGVARLCSATKYLKQTLNWRSAPRASAASECEARHHLLEEACAQNLAPKNLSGIICQNYAGAICPPEPKLCDATTQPARCTIIVKNGLSSAAIIGDGRNSCEAHWDLERVLCLRGIAANIKDANCQRI